jgi:hypothetical protein
MAKIALNSCETLEMVTLYLATCNLLLNILLLKLGLLVISPSIQLQFILTGL